MFVVGVIGLSIVSLLVYGFIRNITVSKEDIKDERSIEQLHIKLDQEIQKLKATKKHNLIEKTVDDVCDQIYALINEDNDKYIIDLHGLFQKQAIRILGDEIKKYVKERYKGRILVITGKGNNSVNGEAKIKPIVENYLTVNKYPFIEVSKGGAYEVSLDKSQAITSPSKISKLY